MTGNWAIFVRGQRKRKLLGILKGSLESKNIQEFFGHHAKLKVRQAFVGQVGSESASVEASSS